jgi:rhomboid protease GluP
MRAKDHRNPPGAMSFAVAARGLLYDPARQMVQALWGAGITARVGREPGRRAGQNGQARTAPVWQIEVDAARAEEAAALIEASTLPSPAAPPPEPIPDALPGEGAGLYWVVGLLMINLLVWWIMEGSGGSEERDVLLRFGAITTPAIKDGQWWRTVTAMFVHIGARHLLGNSALLLVLGVLTLRSWGPGRLLFVYVLSGVLGNWMGFLLGSATALKAGASGAILGLLGGLAGQRWRELQHGLSEGSRFKRWHVIAMLVAFYGFVVGVRPSADHVAHLGALIAGGAIGLVWPQPGTLSARRESRLQWALGASSAILCGVAGLLACAAA